MHRKLLLAFILLLAVGCQTPQPNVIITDKPIIHPPMPARLYLKPIEWSIVNVDTNSYFALTAEGYENLSHNIADITSYIEKTRVLLHYYRSNFTTVPIVSTNKIK